SNGEVEGPRRSVRLEPRVHTLFPHPRRHYRLSRTPPTIVRFPHQATANNAFGLRSATSRSVRAAPEGARRPCSQSCRVRTDTPRRAAKSGCDNPVLARILATSGTL